jgi:hypothetical protein
MMDDRERAIRQRLKDDFIHYAQKCLKIRTKAGKVLPFEMNTAQHHIHACIEEQLANTGKVRAIILKGRQQGCSTYVEGRYYWKVSHRKGVRAFILTHEGEATNNLFELVDRYHEHCPELVRPHTGAANAKELSFDLLDSGYKVGTAGSTAVGRGSTIQYFHGCLSPETYIIDAAGGLTPMRDFSVGDLVRTRTGALASVSFISHQQKALRDIVVKGISGMPLKATDEHRFWTRDGWKRVDQFGESEFIGYPVATITDSRQSWPFRLPDAIRPQGGGSREVGPDCVAPSYDLGKVLGLYLAEGCIVRQRPSGVPSGVTFTVHEREVERTIEWLKPLAHMFRSVKIAPRVDSKTVTVTTYGKSFATFVRSMCGELDGKRLPEAWSNCGAEFVRGLVHGYLAGDGHSSSRPGDRRISAPSIRSAITVGMRDALASLGYGWSCIAYRAGAVRNGRDEKDQWTLRLCGDGVDRLSAEIGWSMPPRKRSGNYGSVVINDGFAWVPVLSVGPAVLGDVMDFEIDDPDHSYCIVHGATHNSEVGFWPNAEDHSAGVLQAVPDEAGTEIIKESTANGLGNYFHKEWQKAVAGQSDYIAIFVPWYWQEEYSREVTADFVLTSDEEKYKESYELTMEQMAWRRFKIADLGELLFKQEYPATAAEAFQMSGHDPYIPAQLVVDARNATAEALGHKKLGVDPARFGEDRTSICFRQGRKVHWIRSYEKRSTMEVAGLVYKAIKEINADQCAVDVGGLGAGVYDRLEELLVEDTCHLVQVNSGSSPIDEVKYYNKRAEMWGETKEWLEKAPADVPDDDELQADLTQIKYSYDSSNRLKMEKKEDMKKRGLRSPDKADSLGLTFAEPVKPPKKKPARTVPRRPSDPGMGY